VLSVRVALPFQVGSCGFLKNLVRRAYNGKSPEALLNLNKKKLRTFFNMIKITTILVLATCAAFAGEPQKRTNNRAPVQNNRPAVQNNVPQQNSRYMATTPAANSRATFYNSSGQKTGSAQTSSRGVTTFQDNANRTTGRAQTTSGGIIFTDSINRTQGKATVTK